MPIFDGAGITPKMVKHMRSMYPVRRIGQVHEKVQLFYLLLL